jgi:hypothetical protein
MILTKNSNTIQTDHISNHAKNYKKNYKICQKNIEKYSDELNITFKNDTNLQVEGKEINKSLKDEIVNWFFSLPIETRFKVATVENCWFINLIHQMYTYYKQNNSSCFEFSKESQDSDLFNQKFYFSTENNDPNMNLDKEMNEKYFQNHFITKSIKRDKHDYYLISMFLKEVRIYSVHSSMDCMTLSPKVLDDKSLFLHYFNCFSQQRSFTKIIEVLQDVKTKLYSFAFPKWIEKDLHQITSYICAFMEQAIIIKFILNYNNKIKDKVITSLFDENSFNDIFKLRKEIIFFLHENYPNDQNNENTASAINNNNSVINSFTKYSSLNIEQDGFMSSFSSLYPKDENVEKFIKNVNIRKIHRKVMEDPKVINTINAKNIRKEDYKEYYYRKLNCNDPLFEGVNDEDTEKKIFKLYLNEDIIVFVDYLIFSKIDSIYQLDYYFGFELLQSIHNLYTDKNALDLIKEFEESNENNNKSKKGKKSKINKIIELTPKEIQKNNFNYYKPYLNKENINCYNYSNTKSIENSINNLNLPCSTNVNGKNNINNYNTITNEINVKEDYFTEKNKEKLNISDILIEINDENKENIIHNRQEEKNKIEHIAEIKIICNEIIIEIINESLNKNEEDKIKKNDSLSDLIDNIKIINNKSKKLNSLILEKEKNEENKTNNYNNNNKNLTIQCAYDISLGHKNQTSNNSNNLINNNKEITNSNNFIIEKHEISIENKTNINNNNINKKISKKNSLININNYNDNNDNENQKEKEKIKEDKDYSQSEKEEESNNSNNENNENEDNDNDNNKEDNLITTSVSNSENENLNEKNKPGRKKKEMVSYVNETLDNDSDDDDPFNKKKKAKKKVQKFYQVNLEKLNKNKNNNNNINKNVTKINTGTITNTTNKSTQTFKEINSLNVNLNITSQNLITDNNNNITNKFEKKNVHTKNIVTNNFNINNNVNINNIKNTSNGKVSGNNNNRNSASSREYSKYDFPKGNKKIYNKKNENKINNTNNIIDSPIKEKGYSNLAGYNNTNNNNNSLIYKSNKDFNQNYYVYDTNRNNNQYNINLNYDLNYEGNYYNNNNNNYSMNNNSFRYHNNRKRSNNWNDNCKKIPEQSYNNNNTNSNYSSISILNTPCNNNEFLSYVFKLHYDILAYHNTVLEIVNSLKDIKKNVISCIEKYLKNFIEYEISLDVFGSFASELSIESSDIDLKVNINTEDSNDIDYEDLIFNLVKKFNSLEVFEFVMPIHTASVPVIKLVN